MEIKKNIMIIILVGLFGLSIFPQEMDRHFYGYIWELHYAFYSTDGSVTPYKLYKNFYFEKDYTLRDKKNRKIGNWNPTLGGFTLFIGNEGMYGSLNFIKKSTIMGGSGEINKPPWYIKIQIVRKNKLPKCRRGSS